MESAVQPVMLGVLAVGALLVAVRSPFHAFGVFAVTLPFESALAFKGPVTITPAYLALPVAWAVLWAHAGRRPSWQTLRSPMTGAVCAYLAVAAASLVMTALAPPPGAGDGSPLLRWRLSGSRSLVQCAFLGFSASAFFITLWQCSTPERLRFATRLFVVVSAVIALYGLFQVAGIRFGTPLIGPYAAGLVDTPASLRPNATFQEAMNFGHFLIAGTAVLFALLLHAGALPAPDRFAYGIAGAPMLLVMLTALGVTIGRAAWMGAAVALLLVMAMAQGPARRKAVLVGVAAALVAAVFVQFAYSSFEAAWVTVSNRFQFSSAALEGEQRVWYFPFLMGLAREFPVLGVGYGNYPSYQVTAFGLWGIAGAYGVFWQALVETGVLGFTALVMLVASALVAIGRALRTARDEWRIHLIGWFGAIAGLMTAHLFFGDRFSLYMWVVLGLAMATVKQARRPMEQA